jgi:DNA-binding GntR family transcriptional regulator
MGRMKKTKSKISDEVIKEIFSKKLKRYRATEWVYTELKKMILSRKFKKGQMLLRAEIAHEFSVSETIVAKAFSQLKKDKLIVVKGGTGSFVA